jgi:tetratricopeptide (TPR) repeat protein
MSDGAHAHHHHHHHAAPAYRAFISYSHRDKAFASWVHREMEGFRVPAKLVNKITAVGTVPRRLHPIFRDRDELPASSDLGAELMAALQRSMFLIVICSPAGAKSHWVDQEILHFKRMHGEGRVLALVVGGIPAASDKDPDSPDEAFPRSLRYRLGEDGELSDVRSEPLAADLRQGGDGKRLAKLKLVAGLTGLRLDDLVQREAQRRTERLALVTAASLSGMVLTGGLALYANARRIEANLQRNEANRQRIIAQKEAKAAKAASDYLVGTFELSNPAKENPRTITALTILGRSAERARQELSGQPDIQARLLATLGRAYNNLGLFPESRSALEPSMPQIQAAGPDGSDALLVLATTYLQQSQFEDALNTVKRAEHLLGPDVTQHAATRAAAAALRGRILTQTSDVKRGLAAFDQALAFYKAAPDAAPTDVARALDNRGLLLSDDGQYKAAEQSLRQSLDLYTRYVGENELRTGQVWFALAENSMQANELPTALTQIGRSLAIERKVLETDNPILADSLSLQGQIYQGLGRLPEAERSLRESIAIYKRAYGKPNYPIGIAEVYLGLVQSARGDSSGALATLDDARHNYDVGYGKLHPNHGDLMVNRAKVLAKAGRMREADASCAKGIEILKQTLGPNESFTKSSEADCAKLGGRRSAGG